MGSYEPVRISHDLWYLSTAAPAYLPAPIFRRLKGSKHGPTCYYPSREAAALDLERSMRPNFKIELLEESHG